LEVETGIMTVGLFRGNVLEVGSGVLLGGSKSLFSKGIIRKDGWVGDFEDIKGRRIGSISRREDFGLCERVT